MTEDLDGKPLTAAENASNIAHAAPPGSDSSSNNSIVI
jgi:hypothetical protein